MWVIDSRGFGSTGDLTELKRGCYCKPKPRACKKESMSLVPILSPNEENRSITTHHSGMVLLSHLYVYATRCQEHHSQQVKAGEANIAAGFDLVPA
jgi:hypothetical protein